MSEKLETIVEYLGKVKGNFGTNKLIGPFDDQNKIKVRQEPFEFLTVEIYKIRKDSSGKKISENLIKTYSIYPIGP